MDMSFWNYVEYRRARKAKRQEKATFCLIMTAVIGMACIALSLAYVL